jgi:hypothetical protein
VSNSGRGARSSPGGVALDRDHELVEVAVADDPTELLLDDEHP